MSINDGEFDDLMPHTIKVTSKSAKDDFTYDTFDPATERFHKCLIDESQSVQRNANGVNLQSGLVAYVIAKPIGSSEPRDILASDKVEIVYPTVYAARVRPIASISRHFWVDGSLHNLEVKFT